MRSGTLRIVSNAHGSGAAPSAHAKPLSQRRAAAVREDLVFVPILKTN
jgi:hypothetical protein